MAEAVIIDAVRTPGGKRNGKLRNWHAADLGSEVLKALAERNDLDTALVDDVIMGCVMQVGEQSLNVGRSAVLAAGYPESVPATTIDRQCGSSQQALHFGAQGVMAGAYDVVIGGGVEVMSRTPMGSSVVRELGFPFGPRAMGRYTERGGLVSQGEGAELIAEQWGPQPPGPRRVLGPVPSAGRAGHSRGTLRARAHRGVHQGRRAQRHRRADHHRRGHPTRLLGRDTGQSEACVPSRERQDHGWQLLADHRRRLGRPDHERGQGLGSRPHPPCPVPLVRGGRQRPDHHADRPHSGHPHGPRAGQADPRRHRRDRDQRGVRLGAAGLGQGARRRHGQGQRERWGDRPRPPPRCLRRQAHGARCSTSWSGPTAATDC